MQTRRMDEQIHLSRIEEITLPTHEEDPLKQIDSTQSDVYKNYLKTAELYSMAG